MNRRPYRGRQRRAGPPPTRDLKVAWVNVGRRQGAHEAALGFLWLAGADVIQIQEPAWWPGTRTKSHPGYERFDPVDTWDSLADRPRVMTYVRRKPDLRANPLQQVSRDILWVEVNGYHLLNFYRQPDSREVLDYLCRLDPPARCIAGGDANAHDPTWDPSLLHPAHGGRRLAEWSKDAGMDFTGEIGNPTHELGSVLDLVFSNVPFVKTRVDHALRTGSDHATLITMVPGRGEPPPPSQAYHVHDHDVPRFVQALGCYLSRVGDPAQLTSANQLDQWVERFNKCWMDAFMAAARPHGGQGRAAPWWNEDCKAAWERWKAAEPFLRPRGSRQPTPDPLDLDWTPPEISDARAQFLATVRKAKKAYWTELINNAHLDSDMYKIVAWHKSTARRRSPPIVNGDQVLHDSTQKARFVAKALLERFSPRDDLPEDPLLGWSPDEAHPALRCLDEISLEEAEARTIGVASTSPGVDRTSVRLLKAAWSRIGPTITALFNRCIAAGHYPRPWRVSEVAIIPKIGKSDYSQAKSYRPIALISCLGKGLERVLAKRMTLGALRAGIISSQHIGALPRRSAPDLTTALTHDVEWALSRNQVASLVTLDVQGAFDALLARRLLARMRAQGWHLTILRMVESFLTGRTLRARLDGAYTEQLPVPCGTPQGSPWSPILYVLYLAELLQQEPRLRFGYADDVALMRVNSDGDLEQNARDIAADVRKVLAYGEANKIQFAAEKTELIHFSRKRDPANPPVHVSPTFIIQPAAEQVARPGVLGKQAAVRWLGVWYDRRITFKRHVHERCARAEKVARHLRSLANTKNGPPAHALRKAIITVVIPTALYAAECWYAGRRLPARGTSRAAQGATASARVGWHIDAIQRAINTAARGCLPVWRTTPNRTLCRDAGIPSAELALEEARLRFAFRLHTLDADHPLVQRMQTPVRARGRLAGTAFRPRTRLQVAAQEFPGFDRPILPPLHFTPGCRKDPTEGLDKRLAAIAFEKWWANLPASDIVAFTDGSQMQDLLGYGFAIYRPGGGEGELVGSGCASLNPCAVVFDAEALGALRGLQHAIRLADRDVRIWVCLDNTAAIWCLRGTPSMTSQRHFLAFHEAAASHPGGVRVKWCPGHLDIPGNETADALAKGGLRAPPDPDSTPTLSGVKMRLRRRLRDYRAALWDRLKAGLSDRYLDWDLEWDLDCPEELACLSRPALHRFLALRTGHGDFAWYHRKFNHPEDSCEMTCWRCHADKTPEHMVFCPKSLRLYKDWPWPDDDGPARPSTTEEKRDYLRWLMDTPTAFRDFIRVTGCFDKRPEWQR